MRADVHPEGDGTRLVLTSAFASTEQMRQMLDMGVEEGLKAATG